jgi:hypothetical protein
MLVRPGLGPAERIGVVVTFPQRVAHADNIGHP